MTMKHFLLPALAAASLPFSTPVLAQAAGEESAVPATSCLRDCLIGLLDQHMAALKAGDPSSLPVSSDLVFTENNVVLPLGSGLWKTVTDVDAHGLEVADKTTGHAAWFGSVKENGTPVFYALRIHVTDGLIDEMESVVHRQTGLPAPFGDWENMEHFPEFNEVLPEEERRPRERMLAIADAYFDTVELNDGQVFAPFSDDCSRLENGITTTAAKPGEQNSAASIAAGCEAQFKLGIYRINKRIRRHLPLVDEERGVVVGAGFFDHANEFDRYNLTNGFEMKTALKWPNSITLLEAFRIRNGEIQRIEATFTYVPYFMHNPFWGPDSSAPQAAPRPDLCDDACLAANAQSVASGMVGNQWQGLNWADMVGYAENSVGLRVGEGIWATVTAIDEAPLVVSDAQSGKAVWIGGIEEHGQPALAALTVSADGAKIGAVDALIRRKEYGAPYAEPGSGAAFPAGNATSRAAIMEGAAAVAKGLSIGQANLPRDCDWIVNGQSVGACSAASLSQALGGRLTLRDRTMLAIDEARGLGVYRYFVDLPAEGEQGYPRSFQIVDVYSFDRGQLLQVQSFTSELPFAMPPQK